ncbi:MFS transporter [Saliphagus sp. GCM10025334]
MYTLWVVDSMAVKRRERIIGGYPGRMLILLTAAYVLMNVARYIVPAMLPEVRANLDLTRTEAGIALSVLSAAYGISQYPGGRYSDSWTRTTVIVPSILIICLGCLFLGGATSFFLLLAGSTIFGIGLGLFSIPARAFLSDQFIETRGRALGVFTVGHDLGGGLAPGLAIVALAVGTWRTPFFPLLVLLAGIAVIVALTTREAFVINRTSLEIGDTTRRLVATPYQRALMISFTFFFFTINGVLYFLPAFLRESKGFSLEWAGATYAFLFFLGLFFKPLVGDLSDRFPRRGIAIVGLLVSGIALWCLLLVESLVGVLVIIVLFSIGYQGMFPVLDALLMDGAPDSNMGGDLGAARTVFQVVGSASPTFVGFMADQHNYAVGFAVLGLCVIVAAAVLLVRKPPSSAPAG